MILQDYRNYLLPFTGNNYLSVTSRSVLYFQHIHKPYECILPIQTGISKPSFFISPFGKASVIVILLRILDDKWYHIMPQTLL